MEKVSRLLEKVWRDGGTEEYKGRDWRPEEKSTYTTKMNSKWL